MRVARQPVPGVCLVGEQRGEGVIAVVSGVEMLTVRPGAQRWQASDLVARKASGLAAVLARRVHIDQRR